VKLLFGLTLLCWIATGVLYYLAQHRGGHGMGWLFEFSVAGFVSAGLTLALTVWAVIRGVSGHD